MNALIKLLKSCMRIKEKNMGKEYAEQVVEKYMKSIYRYVEKRISDEQDAKDIVQEICLKIYKSLLTKEVYSQEAFIWTVVRHVLANYYRSKKRACYNISVDAQEIEIADGKKAHLDNLIDMEEHEKIRKEIAYLSKTQRTILIMYYYEEKKQSEIAEILNIPLGTVKWHLSEAKNELRKGMKKMRNISDLKFNPVKFSMVSLSGSTGEMGDAINFLRSALSQNIVYVIKEEFHTVEEIADAIGVSPVYVESELEFLEKYSIVIRNKDKYISNIIVEEMNKKMTERHEELYKNISSEMANELYDRIIQSGLLKSNDITGKDENYIMWSLIFYLLSEVKSDYFNENISFDEAAVMRADGGKNIITASVWSRDSEEYGKKTGIFKQYGPCWNSDERVKLWLIDGEWTGKRVDGNYGGPNIERDLKLLYKFYMGEKLLEYDYAYLLQNHYIKKMGNDFEFEIVVLKEGDTYKKLWELTKEVKNMLMPKINNALNEYKRDLKESSRLPESLEKQRDFTLQYIFSSDGWFMLYARKALEESGRLKPVDTDLRYSISELLIVKE